MSKSKMRFNTPRTWTAHAERVMREDASGGFVQLHNYNELLYAYRGALVQLDRAAKRIAEIKNQDRETDESASIYLTASERKEAQNELNQITRQMLDNVQTTVK